VERIAGADIRTDPFPHIVVRDALPAAIYDRLLSCAPTRDRWMEAERASVNARQPNIALRAGSATSLRRDEQTRWSRFYPIFEALDLCVLGKFFSSVESYLGKLHSQGMLAQRVSATEVGIGSAVLTERSSAWRIEPHIHDLTQVVQTMLYMPHADDEPQDNGTIFYKLKDSRRVDCKSMFMPFDPRNGAREACVAFADDAVEPVLALPYEPNTMVAFLNTPASIHASPRTTIRRRYAFSCCSMPEGCGTDFGDVDLLDWRQ
jgi:hypothetical protein